MASGRRRCMVETAVRHSPTDQEGVMQGSFPFHEVQYRAELEAGFQPS